QLPCPRAASEGGGVRSHGPAAPRCSRTDARLQTFIPAPPMRPITALALLVLLGSPLAAQRAPTGAIEGDITDSVRVGPLAGAMVTATRTVAGRDSAFVATTDAKGHFRFDSLAVGEYAMRFASPMLDSLQYGGPTAQARVTRG